jgi:glycosyltransferase involved in cell wall biosynthesis
VTQRTMPVLWLDVSTLLHWNRPPVGIVRTEMECARYAAAHSGLPVRFCALIDGTYREIDPISVAERFALIAASSGHEPAAPPPLVRVAQAVVALTRKLPPRLSEEAMGMLRRSRRAVGKLRDVLRRPAGPPAFPPARFESGDVFLTMGLDWDRGRRKVLFDHKLNDGLKLVQVVYDLIPIKLPHMSIITTASVMVEFMVDTIRHADKILCISRHCRSDVDALIAQYGLSGPPMTVVPLGANLIGNSAAGEPPTGIEGEYILYVSTIERRKNHMILCHAYARLVEEGHGPILPKLAFVGMDGWGVSDLLSDIALDPRLQGHVVRLARVDEDELARLYRSCLFTVFPSFYEGWGLGVAEGLSAGKFCLASSAASLPEVGGDLLEYIDPIDGRAWAERLLYYIRDRDALRRREDAIRANYRPITWEAASAVILDEALALLGRDAPSDTPPASSSSPIQAKANRVGALK